VPSRSGMSLSWTGRDSLQSRGSGALQPATILRLERVQSSTPVFDASTSPVVDRSAKSTELVVLLETHLDRRSDLAGSGVETAQCGVPPVEIRRRSSADVWDRASTQVTVILMLSSADPCEDISVGHFRGTFPWDIPVGHFEVTHGTQTALRLYGIGNRGCHIHAYLSYSNPSLLRELSSRLAKTCWNTCHRSARRMISLKILPAIVSHCDLWPVVVASTTE
jgi:hypothetical protein